MELDERKQKILHAIIQTYQETGEPVGSRTISKYTDLNLSSATIRNEMSDLEEMGLIVQPHTSAGRIPSDLGYRLYVDHLMRSEQAERPAVRSDESEGTALTETKDLLIQKVDKLEQMLLQLARVVAASTNYATMVSAPSYNRSKLKYIQLSRVDDFKMLAVIVVEGNIIKNTMFDLNTMLDDNEILSLNLILNNNLNGLSIDEISLDIITRMKEQAKSHSDIVGLVLDAVADAIRPDEEPQIYTSGTTNIFRYPELIDSGKAKELINTFEEKQQLADLLTSSLNTDGEQGIQVYIGNELSVQSMKDCSVVTAAYELPGGLKGTMGIVGPKRMDYEKVMQTLQTVINQLDGIFEKND